MKKNYILSLSLLALSFNLKSQENPVQTLIKEGIELHDSAQYVGAVEKFESALKLNPKSYLALYELSLSYLEMKEYDKALEYSTRVINSNDKSLLVGAYAVKSQALAESGKIDTAIEILKEGIEKNGESYMMHFNLALNYYKKNDIDKTIEHVNRAIELDKTYAGAFLLSAYAQRDKGMWIRSIYSFQMFLLLEPDSRRSRNAFAEMLQAMYIKPPTEEPVERSFIQMQLSKNNSGQSTERMVPPLSSSPVLNREYVYQAIKSTLDSLETENVKNDTFEGFMKVNETILNSMNKDVENENENGNDGFWSFYYPFFKSIWNSNYYEAFCRYVSASYYPESMQWWEENKKEAKNFINWFEKGEDVGNK